MTTKQYILKRIEERWIGKTVMIDLSNGESITGCYLLPRSETTNVKVSEVYQRYLATINQIRVSDLDKLNKQLQKIAEEMLKQANRDNNN